MDSIYCPSLSCQSETQSPEVTWYQNGKLLSAEKSSSILVDDTYVYHQGTYVCDYTPPDPASLSTLRDVVQVLTIVEDTKFKPDILDPVQDTLEVELGKSLTLRCKARFGFEKLFRPVIKWYIQDADREWEAPNSEKKRRMPVAVWEFVNEEVNGPAEAVLGVGCGWPWPGSAAAAAHGSPVPPVLFLYILLGTVMTLVGTLAAGALIYLYWIEMMLLCRSCRSQDETLRDKKEFDAFVSYAKRSSLESEASSAPSEEHLALNLFPEVLENKYGYTLCLLERDVVPGGVYAEDVVSIIKKSRRGIFILSPNYVNGPSVFELQAAVNLALDDQTLKLILIEFRSFQEPESLPHLVKKALRVLPTVTWKGFKSVRPNSRFWTQMRYHMPVKNSRRFK
ncbi:interleukin 18 receptor accessory protein [Ictidomys tridecemlineatus]|nr:interleukin 18 receptor accessory protein [Ictidomys tridecemlineatus]